MRSDSNRIEVEALEAVLREGGMTPLAVAVPSVAEIPRPVAPDSFGAALPHPDSLLRPLDVQVAELEARVIAATLQACKGNKLAAAKQLGISRAKLYDRLLSV